jgi:hypothetical protein
MGRSSVDATNASLILAALPRAFLRPAALLAACRVAVVLLVFFLPAASGLLAVLLVVVFKPVEPPAFAVGLGGSDELSPLCPPTGAAIISAASAPASQRRGQSTKVGEPVDLMPSM